MALGLFVFSEPMTLFLGASPNTSDMVNGYLRILALATPAILISSAFSNIMKTDGKPIIVAAGFYIFVLLKKTKVLSIKISDFTIRGNVLSSVMAIGIPASLISILMSISNIIVNGSIAAYGD